MRTYLACLTRGVGRTLVVIAALGLSSAQALAQSFPDKPITLFVGFAPGGAADSVARTVAEEMSKSLGQRVIIDNKAGASGNIATTTVVTNSADGSML